MPLLPLKIPSDFPDPAVTLAFILGSRGIGNCLTISLILSLSVRLRANPETAPTRPDHLTEMSVVHIQPGAGNNENAAYHHLPSHVS